MSWIDGIPSSCPRERGIAGLAGGGFGTFAGRGLGIHPYYAERDVQGVADVGAMLAPGGRRGVQPVIDVNRF